ncbi:MAG TPA: type VI secretion system protein TssA [Pirellulales bacterium]|nr:type VI secretion system protein TssA [Pirellulales bacterium]
MASAPQVDFDRLLAPIAGGNPCGVDLRWEPIYQEIKSARQRGDRDMLGTDEAPAVEWRKVVDLTSDALAKQSKDLMIASWLVEALVSMQGFAGLRDGVKLVGTLLDTFWDGVYPLPEDGDLETRVAPLVFLTDSKGGARLPNALRDVPLAAASDEAYSWNYWNSRKLSPKGENEDNNAYDRRKAEAEERARKFEEAVTATPRDFVVQLRQDALEAAAELKNLDKVLDARFAKLAPGTTALRQALEEVEALLRRIVRDKGGLAEEASEQPAGEATNGEAAAGGMTPMKGPIASRQEAFRRLAEVAHYLRQTEPQSPVAYLIERAVAWGHMPFEQLLNELIRDEGVRGQVGELLGIRRPESTG